MNILDSSHGGIGWSGKAGTAIVVAALQFLNTASPAAGVFGVGGSSGFNSDSLVEYNASIDISYSYKSVSIGANMAVDRFNSAYFQKHAIGPIENRKKAIELNYTHGYSFSPYIGYRVYSGDRNELIARVSYYRPSRPDEALKFSNYNGIFESTRFDVIYSGVHRNIKTVLRANYSIINGTFKNSAGFGFDSHYGLGRNTVLIFSYDYAFDIEKSDYRNPETLSQVDDSLLDLKHEGRVYRIPKKSLLNKFHRVALANTFDIGEAIHLGIGVVCQIDRDANRSYSLILNFVF